MINYYEGSEPPKNSDAWEKYKAHMEYQQSMNRLWSYIAALWAMWVSFATGLVYYYEFWG